MQVIIIESWRFSLHVYLVLKTMLRVSKKHDEFGPETLASVDSPRISGGEKDQDPFAEGG